MRWRVPLLLILAVLVGGCACKAPEGNPVSPVPAVNVSLPDSRSFYLGMTPFPYDISAQAVADTYRMTDDNTDLILHHFDDGVPWPEALRNSSYNQKFEEDLSYRVSRLHGQKVYLAVTPIAFYRDGIAPYRGEEGNLAMPPEWKNKSFDDPEAINAYTNYCRYMIKKFRPDYFAYGIEVNILARKDPEDFKKFVAMARQVYPVLKQENPGLPIFLSFHIDTYASDKQAQADAIRQLLPYTDHMAVSTYPYTFKQDPAELPADWFSQMHVLAPDKPFAVAETGFMAENLDMGQYNVHLKGSEEWQAEYVGFLLKSANDLDAEFVIWFVPGDYDAMWEKYLSKRGDELVKLWKDCGLVDGNRKARQSLGVWDAWLKLPKR